MSSSSKKINLPFKETMKLVIQTKPKKKLTVGASNNISLNISNNFLLIFYKNLI
jgi:hypothetical protein